MVYVACAVAVGVVWVLARNARAYCLSAERSAGYALDERLRVQRLLSADWRRRRAEARGGPADDGPDEVEDAGWVEFPPEYELGEAGA